MRTRDPVPLLPVVHDGVSRSRRLLLDYVDSEDREVQVAVDPVGLVAKAGIWYLVAVPRSGTGPDDPGNPGGRLFRVARIRACEVTGVPADVPEDSDLEKTWTALRAQAEERRSGLQATLAVAPAALLDGATPARRPGSRGVRGRTPRAAGGASPAPGTPWPSCSGSGRSWRSSHPAISGWRSARPPSSWWTCYDPASPGWSPSGGAGPARTSHHLVAPLPALGAAVRMRTTPPTPPELVP